MGKRKERRLAALSNAGRRVKLDLFAEPSGELGGSTVHGDAGGDIDSQHRDGLPNSPSSSGQTAQNPLMLLGQYSDDEVDEGSSKVPNDKNMQNEEAKGVHDEGPKDLDISVSVDLVAQNDVQNSTLLDVGCHERNESDGAPGNLPTEMASKDQTYSSESFDERVLTDVGFGWKMVMHEESQRYYYWNIETGETSWEVPQALGQADQSTNDLIPRPSVYDKTESAAVGINNSNAVSAVMPDNFDACTVDGHGSQMNGGSGECINENQGSDDNGNELIGNDGLKDFSYGGDHSSVSKFSVEEQQLEIDFPSRLVKQSESLLEKLKSLIKSNGNMQGKDFLSKYMLEVEIRLSDLRSLESYGSSLLPFWVHSDKRIKVIESLINDLLQTANLTHVEVEDRHVPVAEGMGERQHGMGHESEMDHNQNKGRLHASDVSDGCQADASAVVLLEDINNKISTNGQHGPLYNSPGRNLETEVGVNAQVEATLNPEESTHKQGYTIGEDVDMDVDMEVEDMNPSGNVTDVSVAEDLVQTDKPVQLNPPVDYHSVLPEDEFVVPPPPDDEWIPPPPPDNEQVPPPPPPPPHNDQVPPPPPDSDQVPPPPGDPLAPYGAFPLYTETGQPLSYVQYSLSYPGASAEYYGPTAADVSSSNIYGQIAMQPAQLYYSSAVPNMYGEHPQVMINPTDPVAYYEVQDGGGSKSTPAININDTGVSVAEGASGDAVLSTSSSIHAPATVSFNDGVSLPSATAEATAEKNGSTLVSKGQTKVIRSRKRTVAVGSSLKSNKKVSSLVDKWKAAKEELLEEEEEPESVYEIIERKRQREIEEWRAKQIASGEAKDNANFQPLGGDWREKVKRKRAQAANESVGTMQDASGPKQDHPDLVELSKGLPSNWQVYWDETTKQVYYGNIITSETTWTRPTR